MPDLADGESTEVQGSAATPYVLRNVGGVYSCTCPAWRNQGVAIEKRSCKHLVKLRGAEAEAVRTGGVKERAVRPASSTNASETDGDGEAKAPPLLLAHPWSHDVDLTGWWMSEKLDGIRGYWDGTQFISRLGNRFFAPKWFVEAMPRVVLDGELWGGRKKFQRTNGIVRRQDESELWREISFLVFDAPAMEGPFEARLAFVEETLGKIGAAHLKAHAHVKCEGVEHLKAELARVEALGGEGLMMRKPGSRYEVGRSHTLLKVKTFKDAEARVVDYVAGAGKHKGKVGALLLELPDGTRFSAGTGLSDEERRNPPPVGAIVTFRYQELSETGVPRFPTYVGVRHDFAWPAIAKGTPPPGGPNAPIAKAMPPSGDPNASIAKAIPPSGDPNAPIAKGTPPPGGPNAPIAKAIPPSGDPNASIAKGTPPSGGPNASIAKGMPPQVDPNAPIAKRTFTFEEGSSSKFWETWTEGARMFVRFGKIGGAGQTKVKVYGSHDEAARASEALVAEKTKKGYRRS